MAYSPFYPATYQQMYYQNPYQQQMQIQQPQSGGIIWVSSDSEAESYPIAPNNAVRLWHSSLPIVYFKSADASGKPTIKSYTLVERSESTDSQDVKICEYATKSDLEQISCEIEAIKADMKAAKKELKRKRKEEEDYNDDDD